MLLVTFKPQKNSVNGFQYVTRILENMIKLNQALQGLQDLSNLQQLNPLERCLYVLALHQEHTLLSHNTTVDEVECLRIASWYEFAETTGMT